MLIDLPIQEYAGWRTVKAEIVDVAPHLPATFAVHKCPWYSGWRVSHVETGAFVALGNTKRAALAEAIKRSAKVTPERYHGAVRKQFSEYRKRYGAALAA